MQVVATEYRPKRLSLDASGPTLAGAHNHMQSRRAQPRSSLYESVHHLLSGICCIGSTCVLTHDHAANIARVAEDVRDPSAFKANREADIAQKNLIRDHPLSYDQDEFNSAEQQCNATCADDKSSACVKCSPMSSAVDRSMEPCLLLMPTATNNFGGTGNLGGAWCPATTLPCSGSTALSQCKGVNPLPASNQHVAPDNALAYGQHSSSVLAVANAGAVLPEGTAADSMSALLVSGTGDGNSLLLMTHPTATGQLTDVEHTDTVSSDDNFWDASSNISSADSLSDEDRPSQLHASVTSNDAAENSARTSQALQPHDSCIHSTNQLGLCLRMDVLPHLRDFNTTPWDTSTNRGPSKPLPFLGADVTWQRMPAVTGFGGHWLKVAARCSPPPLPIDVMLQANWLTRKAHESIKGVQITEDSEALTITAKLSIMGAPIQHKEVYYKDGHAYRCMLRRDLKPGYAEHCAYWTACGELVLLVECYSLGGRLDNGGVEVLRRIDGGHTLHFTQARYDYLTRQAAQQEFVCARSSHS